MNLKSTIISNKANHQPVFSAYRGLWMARGNNEGSDKTGLGIKVV